MEPSAAKIATLIQETQTRALDLGDVRFRTDSQAIPFRGSTVFGRQGTRFSWSFVDSDPAGITVFAQDVSTNPENGPVFSWPEHGATVNSTYPTQAYQAYVPCDPSGAAIDDGVVMTLQNLLSNETFTLSGLNPPIGSNVTLSSHNIYVNANGVAWGQGFSGSVFFDSGWRANFDKGIFADGSIGRETVGGSMVFIPPPSRRIAIANATFTSAANRTLDFDISTSNSTISRWTVDLQQNNTTIRSFPPTVDTRGPGTSSGVNPLHVSLAWDGLDAANHTVSGNVTWLVNARTTNYVAGGPVNDRIDSAQVVVNATLLAQAAPTIRELSSDTVTMLDVNNKPIKLPQYDLDHFKHDPMAIPFRAKTAKLEAFISVKFGPDDPAVTYVIWGEDDQKHKLTPQIPVRFDRLDQGHFVTFPLTLPDQIKKIDKINWFYFDPKEGGDLSMGSTNSPLYVILDKPWIPVEKPRVDVLDYAVRLAEAEQAKDELTALKALTEGINQRSGYRYDLEDTRAHHTEDSDDGQVFTVSDFIAFGNRKIDPEGNCQDFANLLQVSGASLGVKGIAFRVIGAKERRGKRSAFYIFPVKPIGLDLWFKPPDNKPLTFHQSGFYLPNSRGAGRYFDPTYTLNQSSPVLPVNMDETTYESSLFDAARSKPGRWDPQPPDVPYSVR